MVMPAWFTARPYPSQWHLEMVRLRARLSLCPAGFMSRAKCKVNEMAKHDAITATYGVALKGWHKPTMGSKPGLELFEQAHALGCRPGKQALARALELRADGATDGQIKAACIAQWGNSGSHHNKRGELATAKLVKVTKTKPGAHTVYRIELTPKGVERVKGAVDTATATPAAKPARKRTSKPAKVNEPAPVVVDPAPVDQPQA